MTVAKEPGERGEHEGNRSNHCVRGCRVIPVYSLFLVCVLPLSLHTRPRVHWASGIPHALFRARDLSNGSGAWRGEVVKSCLESRCRHSSCPGLTHRWPARFVLEGVHGIDSIRFQLVTNHLDSKGDQSRAASEYRLS